MKEIPLTRGLVALVDDEDYEELSKHKWWAHNRGYACRTAYDANTGKSTAILMHRQILGMLNGDKRDVDHRNRNRLDNRRENIRACSRVQNLQNRSMKKNSKSGYKGVSWFPLTQRWHARIGNGGRTFSLGYYDTPEEAHKAYCEAAERLWGEFACAG